MRYRLPPNVERNVVKGHVYYAYRVGKGARIKLPDPASPEFGAAYQAAVAGSGAARPSPQQDEPRSLGALIASYYDSEEFAALRASSKEGYRRRLELMRAAHGHRSVAGLTRERIEAKILKPLANRPGAKLDTLKKLRILIRHAKALHWINSNPSEGIKRGKSKEIRAWTDNEMAAFEKRWPYGTRQRAAYEMMLNVGTARADTHLTTWTQAEHEIFEYTRRKTRVAVVVSQAESLRQALAALPRRHMTILVTEWGKPFTVDGFSGWMRDAMTAAGLPLDCKPHGLRKTLGRLLADAGATAHDIMAALGHMTLAEAERYTREADRRRGGKRALVKLEDHKANRIPQTPSSGLGKEAKS
ncbi:tyrosine-type recombinase/integrase (plasmid) [Bradyrhizobium oligotrophicum S58]